MRCAHILVSVVEGSEISITEDQIECGRKIPRVEENVVDATTEL